MASLHIKRVKSKSIHVVSLLSVILVCLLFARTVNQQLNKMGDESVKQFCYAMPKIVST